MSVRLLDLELLTQFEQRLVSCGVPMERLEPGLSDAEIDDIIAPTDLQLPEEVRVWWRWHDGEQDRRYVPILPSREPHGLRYEVDCYLDRLETEADTGAQLFPPQALQPISEQPIIFVQCHQQGHVPAPVYVMGSWSGDYRLVLPSFGELVLQWMRFIDEGVYAVSPEGGWDHPQGPSPAWG